MLSRSAYFRRPDSRRHASVLMHNTLEKIAACVPIIVVGMLLIFFVIPSWSESYTYTSPDGAGVPVTASTPPTDTVTSVAAQQESASSGYTYTPYWQECCPYPEPTSEPAPEQPSPTYTYTSHNEECCTYPTPEPTPEPPTYTYTPNWEECCNYPEPTSEPEPPPYTYTPVWEECCTYPQPPQELPLCLALTASDHLVSAGDYVTLSWNTQRADTVTLNHGIGVVSANGNRVVQINGDITYTLSVSNANGNANCQITILVEDDVIPPPPGTLSCDALTVSDTRVERGDYVTLVWRTTGSNDVRINNGIGNVSPDGETRVRVFSDITYMLTVQDAGRTDTCQVTIVVEDEPDEDAARCDSFTISDRRVDRGDYVTLRWRTTNADDVRISGLGDVADDGEERVRITRDTTFTLTASNFEGTDTCRVSVEVDDDDDDFRCRLTVSDRDPSVGESIMLRWNNRNADRAILRDDHGREYFDTRNDRGYDEDSDSITVRPTRPTEYTLTVYNGGQRETCKVAVDIEAPVTVARFQDRILMQQLPYTGVETGSGLALVFLSVAGLWVIIMGYLVAVRMRIL